MISKFLRVHAKLCTNHRVGNKFLKIYFNSLIKIKLNLIPTLCNRVSYGRLCM